MGYSNSYFYAFVFNRAYKDFEDNPIKLSELLELKKSRNSRFNQIVHDLYSRKDNSKEYKLIFCQPKKRRAYLRRANASNLKSKGFSSVCETELHRACKEGIKSAERVKIWINKEVFVIEKKSADIETVLTLMEREYETDCDFYINKNEAVERILLGNRICFEVHHKSAVKQDKGLSYMLSGLPMIEFDVPLKYVPKDIIREQNDFDEAVAFFKNFYENTDKHYIDGVFYAPMQFRLTWKGNVADVTLEEEDDIQVRIFERNDSYRILYKQGLEKRYDNDYFDKAMKERVTAMRFAEYRVYEHLQGIKSLF